MVGAAAFAGVTTMALQTYSFGADSATGAPGGDYVSAEVAQQLEQTLSKLVWTVLYGKMFDASGVAVSAEQMLGKLKATQISA
jgi:hypothetical protein